MSTRRLKMLGVGLLAELLAATSAAAQNPRLFYEADGEGPAIVFVADWALDTGSWFRLLPGLRQGRRLVRYDLRGQGRSEAPVDGDYGMPAHVADLTRIVDGLGLDRVDLVGAGLGASVAVAFAYGQPDRVRTLTVINPSFVWTDRDRAWWERFQSAYDRTGRPSLGNYASVLAERWVGSAFANREPWIVPALDLMLRRQDPEPLMASLRSWMTFEPIVAEGDPRRLPVLLVRGARTIQGHEPALGELFGSVRYRPLEGIGGIPQIEAPKRVAREIDAFLGSTP